MRVRAFFAVGAGGFALQMAALALLLAARCPYLPATAVAVEAAVLHNFFWHERWTWADRTAGQPGVVRRFARFNLSTGAASIFGNVMFMAVYVDGLGIHPLLANALAVASTAVVNFLVADRWVFSSKGGREGTDKEATKARRHEDRLFESGLLCGADRFHGEAGSLEAGAEPGSDLIRARRVAVDADGLAVQVNNRPVVGDDGPLLHEPDRALEHDGRVGKDRSGLPA